MPSIIAWGKPGTVGVTVGSSGAQPGHFITAAHLLKRLGDDLLEGHAPVNHGTPQTFPGVTLGAEDPVVVIEFDDDSNFSVTLPCGPLSPVHVWDAAAFCQAQAMYAYSTAIQAQAMRQAQDAALMQTLAANGGQPTRLLRP